MSKNYNDLERIAGLLERIASSLEKLSGEEKPLEEPKEEKPLEEAEEIKEEAPEAEKEPKQEVCALYLYEEKEEKPLEEAEEIKEEAPEAEKEPKEERSFLEEAKEILKEADKFFSPEEPKKADAKRGEKKRDFRKTRINPYRIKEEPKKGPVSGFRIKEK